jgi:Major Facilitator Superfamily
MLLLGFIINFIVLSIEQPLTPSATIASRYLGVSVSAIHWLKYAWSLAAVVGAIPGLLAVERAGLRKAGFVCACALLLGASLRLGELGTATRSNTKSGQAAYNWLLAGSVASGLLTVPMQAMTTFVAASWFDDGQRGLANTLVRSCLVLCVV